MSINRNSYKSLLESINESVSTEPKKTIDAANEIQADDEIFDAIDEILAEGIELYGEEGLAEILADFAKTGKLSKKLSDLIG
jgi:hypothetical protein